MSDAVADNAYVPSKIKTSDPLHQPMDLTQAQRAVFRERSRASREAKKLAMQGETTPIHEINHPCFDPLDLMPQLEPNGIPAISLFSGGGGLDFGFDRAGFTHCGSWDTLEASAETLHMNRPNWNVHAGAEGDVRTVDWRPFRGNIAVVHGGPPCQPFSNAGRRRGKSDPRNMWPEFVRAIDEIRPDAFVAENVAALASASFSEYVSQSIIEPLGKWYSIHTKMMQAYEYGVPQTRKRVVFFGFRTKALEENWVEPRPQWSRCGAEEDLPCVMGVREALGLPEIGYDDVCPTLRSGLTGPRHTTSILNSVSAQKKYARLEIWPNGVAASRAEAQAFVTKNGHFRLSVPDVKLIQGFPEGWSFAGATYMQLGQIGNSVAPPVAYSIATSILSAFSR